VGSGQGKYVTRARIACMTSHWWQGQQILTGYTNGWISSCWWITIHM
jgi:hypothetical protein